LATRYRHWQNVKTMQASSRFSSVQRHVTRIWTESANRASVPWPARASIDILDLWPAMGWMTLIRVVRNSDGAVADLIYSVFGQELVERGSRPSTWCNFVDGLRA
jgi:hypothetical protein